MFVVMFNYGPKSLRQIHPDADARDRAIAFINQTPGTKNVTWIEVPDPEPAPA